MVPNRYAGGGEVTGAMDEHDVRGADAATVLPPIPEPALETMIADVRELVARGIDTESRVAARFPLRAALKLLDRIAARLPAVTL